MPVEEAFARRGQRDGSPAVRRHPPADHALQLGVVSTTPRPLRRHPRDPRHLARDAGRAARHPVRDRCHVLQRRDRRRQELRARASCSRSRSCEDRHAVVVRDGAERGVRVPRRCVRANIVVHVARRRDRRRRPSAGRPAPWRWTVTADGRVPRRAQVAPATGGVGSGRALGHGALLRRPVGRRLIRVAATVRARAFQNTRHAPSSTRWTPSSVFSCSSRRSVRPCSLLGSVLRHARCWTHACHRRRLPNPRRPGLFLVIVLAYAWAPRASPTRDPSVVRQVDPIESLSASRVAVSDKPAPLTTTASRLPRSLRSRRASPRTPPGRAGRASPRQSQRPPGPVRR